jgi:hypothetical protein
LRDELSGAYLRYPSGSAFIKSWLDPPDKDSVSLNRARFIVGIGIVLCGLSGYFIATSSHGKSAQAAPQPSAQSIQAGAFTADVPAGWTVTRKTEKGATGYHLSSTGAPINGLGIGPAGTVGITVSESGTIALTRGHIDGKPLNSYSATQLLPFLVGQPAQATSIARAQPPTAGSLDGQADGEEASSYTYEGREILQIDVLAKRAHHIIMIELDTEPALASKSHAALQTVSSSWHWH